MEIEVAEIPPRAGFTSKERDAEPGFEYGVYPALGGSARYYDQRFAVANSWLVGR